VQDCISPPLLLDRERQEPVFERLNKDEVPLNGHIQRWEGYVHLKDFKQQFILRVSRKRDRND
jgi:hypothetical protein